jgi:PEP-CTERM motif
MATIRGLWVHAARLLIAIIVTMYYGMGLPSTALAGTFNLPRTGSGGLLPGITEFDRNVPGPNVPGIAIVPDGVNFERNPGSSIDPGAFNPFPAVNFGTPVGSFLDLGFPCGALHVVGVGAGEICRFSDFVLSAPNLYHFELEIHNPGGVTPHYNVFFFTPEGISGGTVKPMAVGASYFFDVLSNDALIGDVGGRFWWLFSSLPFSLEVTSSITEGGVYPLPLFPCPRTAAVACGGVAGFSPDPTDALFEDTVDDTLPGFFFMRPADFDALNASLPPQNGFPAPEPSTLVLISSGLLGMAVYGRFMRRQNT